MYNGIFVMDKPMDFSSHDVVAKLRGILRQKKIGHSGTLDPMATGVLPIFLGTATKAADFAMAQAKEYIATFRLGTATDTLDITGTVTKTCDKAIAPEAVKAAIDSFLGKSDQLPPMYSAIWVEGRRLYDLARQGIEVERATREIHIAEIELLSHCDLEYTIRVVASKGTYIRSLCSDIGEAVGSCAVLTVLRRSRSGSFVESNALTLEQVQALVASGQFADHIQPTDSVLQDFPICNLDDYALERGKNGAFIDKRFTDLTSLTEGQTYRAYHNGQLVLLCRASALDKGGLALFGYKRFYETT